MSGGQKRRSAKSLGGRRSRVVPVVTQAQRRRWQRGSETDRAALLHLLYLQHRENYLPQYFDKHRRVYSYPRNRFERIVRWYIGDVLLQSRELLKQNGEFVKKTAGVPIWRQRIDLVRLSLQLPSMPENYYKFEWYRPENAARVNEYLHRHETKGVLYRMLSEHRDLDQLAPLTDKVGFAKQAMRKGLPVTQILAVFSEGKVVEAVDEFPRQDIFVKPQAGRGGSGAQVWEYDNESDTYRLVGKKKAVPHGAILDVLAKRSEKRSLIAQVRLTNHPSIADIALDAVPTCRVVTITNEVGEGEPVMAALRMPALPDKVVDNIHAGGISAPVDITTGTVGKATDLGLAPSGRYTHHPQTGALIEGKVLPYWEDILKLAASAHSSFTPRVLVGWDISIGPAGPILVEGNSQPCVDILQRTHDAPLAPHRLGELLTYQLRRRFPADS